MKLLKLSEIDLSTLHSSITSHGPFLGRLFSRAMIRFAFKAWVQVRACGWTIESMVIWGRLYGEGLAFLL